MKGYIHILLEALEEHDREYLGWEDFLRSERAAEAAEALDQTFSDEQRGLFQEYEDRRAAAENGYRTALARQAFLLAREIYR